MTTIKDKPTLEVSAEVRVKQDGAERVEVWTGVSKRHALLKARDHYRGIARCDFAGGMPF